MSKEERTSVSAAPQSTMIKWPWWKKFLIGSGEFGENMSNAMFTTYISIFYTDIAGIAPALVTLIVWITKIWDAINDILVGVLADRTHTKLGRYRPWIILSAIPMVVVTFLSFLTNPGWSYGLRVAFAILTYCAFTWVYTMFYIPYVSVQATLTHDPNERASIGSVRVALAVLASWIVGFFAPNLIKSFSGPVGVSMSYAMTALVFSAIGAPFILLSGIVAREYIKPAGYDSAAKKPKREKIQWGKLFGAMKSNKYLTLVIIGALVGQIFMAGRNATIVYYFTYRMESLALLPLFITLLRFPMMAGNFCSQYFVRWTGSKGKVISWAYILCAVLCMTASLTDGMTNLTLFFILSGAMHFFTGVAYAQSNVVISDTVDYTEYLTGQRVEGFTSSFVSFFGKVGNAVGISLTPLILALTGYVPNATQSPQVITGIMSCMYYIPAALALLTGVAFFGYKLDNHHMRKIADELQARRAAALQEARD